jgi:AcrR family transcriptional regulator
MKPGTDSGSRQRTRRAILEAMADVITDTNGIGFSVQAVADRAGVTHRTIYNYFPTREALCEAFSEYVDELLASAGRLTEPLAISIASLPAVVEELYRTLALRDRYVRASVMLMLGNRRPMKAWRGRTHALEKEIARGAGGPTPLAPRQAVAAVRMFASSVGWHVLTEQIGLSADEAAVTSAWATRTLLEAAIGRRAATPSSRRSQRGAHATRPRRG